MKENPGAISCCCFPVISNPCRINSLLGRFPVCLQFQVAMRSFAELMQLLVSRIMGIIIYEKVGIQIKKWVAEIYLDLFSRV